MLITMIFLLIVGFVLLVKGADVFVDGAVNIAHRFGIPTIIIGTTIVAIGTSAPEAAISIAAAIKNADGVSIGNVIGSNITNILLILGITAAIAALPIHKNTKKYEIPFVGFITLLLCLFGFYFGEISRPVAGILFGLFIAFMTYMIVSARNGTPEQVEVKSMSVTKTILMLVIGIAALILGSNLTVDSAVDISHHFGVSDRVIGLTLIALGTSLPELVVCIAAALKKQYDLAVGNIVGSNIFNILFVLGLAGLVRPIPFQPAFITDAAIALFAVTLLMIFAYRNSKLSRIGGLVFLGLYIAYTLYLVA
ncbi:MAG: calcium/sodium antiporter [Alphaproteobacteria bacterium]|nr:calcium/sodium antiporter [Alphaproteobacteria bacterium]